MLRDDIEISIASRCTYVSVWRVIRTALHEIPTRSPQANTAQGQSNQAGIKIDSRRKFFSQEITRCDTVTNIDNYTHLHKNGCTTVFGNSNSRLDIFCTARSGHSISALCTGTANLTVHCQCGEPFAASAIFVFSTSCHPRRTQSHPSSAHKSL